MVVSKIPAGTLFRSALLFGACLYLDTQIPLIAQQSNLQTAMFPRAMSNVDLADSDSDSYNTTMAKRPTPFRPNSSDVLIGQAEEKFQSGRHSYQVKDADTARKEFDNAIDLMLQASENPTDRRLYEEKLEQMVDAIHRFDLAGLGAGEQVEEAQFDKAPLDDIIEMTFPVDPKIKGKVAGEVKETASQLPLVSNDAVLSYINYFSGRGHRTVVAGLERAARYQPMISRILAEEGVPQELIHLAQAESGFLPRAISNKAAVGMWQFVQFRGNQYGLHQTPLTDDRLDPEKATRAAAHHLHDLYREFGDWYLAIAAYNCGPGNIEKAVERTGYADFWELRNRHALPQETSNYVPIILAMTIMTKNAEAYGLTDIHPEPALDYDTIKVTSSTHLALVGDMTDTPVSQLLEMNPALLKNIAPANYELHVPKNSGDKLQAALEMFPSDHRASWRMHRVENGESLASIAQQYNVPVSGIEDANRIANGGPQPGDKLIIPVAYHEAPVGHSRSSRTSYARAHSRRGLSVHLASSRSHSSRRAIVSHVAAHVRRPASRHRA